MYIQQATAKIACPYWLLYTSVSFFFIVHLSFCMENCNFNPSEKAIQNPVWKWNLHFSAKFTVFYWMLYSS